MNLYKLASGYAAANAPERQALATALTETVRAHWPAFDFFRQAATQGGQVVTDSIHLLVLECRMQQNSVHIKAQIFFDELVGGCNCSEDPLPQGQAAVAQLLVLADNSLQLTMLPDAMAEG